MAALPCPEEINMSDFVGNMVERPDAISVKNAWKKYGEGDRSTQVLSDLTLNVKEGTIYTLLGSSGCASLLNHYVAYPQALSYFRKTTILSCIVGTTKLDQGECLVLGIKPGTPGCGVPGKKIGFMPQETALYREFTIREALRYFGGIHGMTTSKIDERTSFLIKLLHLPPSSRFIRSLSGGQQRRVSIAIALLHEPKILILDEPTVGVDPLLRRSIWKHLRTLVKTSNTTVVITTHYVEEANDANRIGLMRNGHLLDEDTPQHLLEKYECGKLEDVFFKLCELDQLDSATSEKETVRPNEAVPPPRSNLAIDHAKNTNNDNATVSSLKTETGNGNDRSTLQLSDDTRNPQNGIQNPTFDNSAEQCIDEKPGDITPNTVEPDSTNTDIILEYSPQNELKMYDQDAASKISGGFWDIMWALLCKEFFCMWRNIGFVVFIFLLPPIQAILFCLAVGGELVQLPFGVVNYENLNHTHCQVIPGCLTNKMSCNFLNHISNETINLKVFQNENEARYEVQQGNSWGYLVIPENFTDAIIQRSVSGCVTMAEESFHGMHVKLSLDQSSQQISFTIQRTLSEAFQKFTKRLLGDCGMNGTIESPPSSVVNLIIKLIYQIGVQGMQLLTIMFGFTAYHAFKVADPIYGNSDTSFREFMAPGVVLSIIFFMSVALTGSAFITERKEGMLNRSLVAGVTTVQIILAHMITQYIIMFGQTILVFVVMVLVFGINISGSTTAAVFLTLLQGTCGMAYGFLISCICTEERNAIQMALGSFYPNLLLSGVVWPSESMPVVFRQIVQFLPQTLPCEAMRSIFSRAWPITHPKVWPAFAISIVWSFCFIIFAIVLASRQRRQN